VKSLRANTCNNDGAAVPLLSRASGDAKHHEFGLTPSRNLRSDKYTCISTAYVSWMAANSLVPSRPTPAIYPPAIWLKINQFLCFGSGRVSTQLIWGCGMRSFTHVSAIILPQSPALEWDSRECWPGSHKSKDNLSITNRRLTLSGGE
jgi:hypothetical protein